MPGSTATYMITINGESELVEITSYEQLLQRPRFIKDLDPAKFTLTKLIGVYGLESECPCGLTDCHTGHKRGYLAADDDGHETNIGNRCGRNLFGANWHMLRNTLNADIRMKRHRETVLAFQAAISVYYQRAEQLRTQPLGAHWAWQGITDLHARLPHRLWSKLERMIKEDDGTVIMERLATDDEIAAEEARLRRTVKRPHYVQALGGYVHGLAAMQPAHNFRQILSIDIVEKLHEIEKLDVEKVRPGHLAEAAKWIASLEPRYAHVADVLDLARSLLSKNNLIQLQHLGLNSSEVSQLKRAISKLPQSYIDPSTSRAA